MKETTSKGGRPSKLTNQKWDDLLRRLAGGEKATDLAKVFHVSKTSISKRVSKPAETLKTLAGELVEVETKLEELPVSQQNLIRNLANQMKTLGTSTFRAATLNAQAAEIVSEKGLLVAQALPTQPSSEDLRPLAAAAETTNKLLSSGLALLGNDRLKEGSAPTMTLGELLGQVNREDGQP